MRRMVFSTTTVACTMLSLCLLLACGVGADRPSVHVSLVNLLSDPDQYADRNVTVVGYLKDLANLRLFLTEDHALVNDTLSSILISDTDSADILQSGCLMMYVQITGQFVEIDPNSYGLVAVDRVYDPKKRNDCWEIDE